MPRKSNTEARRAEIVAAMLPVLARHGYEKATIQAIAREAGIAPGLIHYHFENKREILVSLLYSIAEFAQARFQQKVGDATDPIERLRAYFEARLGLNEGASPSVVAAWVMIGAEAVRSPEVREIYQRAIAGELDLLRGLLSDCLIAQGGDGSRAERLGAGLVAFMEGVFHLASSTEALMPEGHAANMAMDLAMAWINAKN